MPTADGIQTLIDAIGGRRVCLARATTGMACRAAHSKAILVQKAYLPKELELALKLVLAED